GIVLSLTTEKACQPEEILCAARHLGVLCANNRLERLRIGEYQFDRLRAWNYHRINTGLAHGVTGVAAALRAAMEVVENPDEFARPLQHICQWLMSEAYIDERGIWAWLPAGLDGENIHWGRAVARRGAMEHLAFRGRS